MSVRGIVYIALLVVGSVLHAHAAGFLTFPLRRKLGLEDPDPAVNRSLASFKGESCTHISECVGLRNSGRG